MELHQMSNFWLWYYTFQNVTTECSWVRVYRISLYYFLHLLWINNYLKIKTLFFSFNIYTEKEGSHLLLSPNPAILFPNSNYCGYFFTCPSRDSLQSLHIEICVNEHTDFYTVLTQALISYILSPTTHIALSIYLWAFSI